MRKTLSKLIVLAISQAKRPLVNEEIRTYVTQKRPTTSAATVDVTLNQAAKKGLIEKTPVTGKGAAKYAYSIPKRASVASVVQSVVKGSKIDSMEVFLATQSVLPNVTKHATDNALYQLSRDGVINKSKNPMTDSNTISTQSKFLYSAK